MCRLQTLTSNNYNQILFTHLNTGADLEPEFDLNLFLSPLEDPHQRYLTHRPLSRLEWSVTASNGPGRDTWSMEGFQGPLLVHWRLYCHWGCSRGSWGAWGSLKNSNGSRRSSRRQFTVLSHLADWFRTNDWPELWHVTILTATWQPIREQE